MAEEPTQGLHALWAQVRADFQRALTSLPSEQDHQYLNDLREFLDHNELELACDMLGLYADEQPVSSRFWLALRDAADKMKLAERAKNYECRAAASMTPKEQACDMACEIANALLEGRMSLVEACRRIQRPLDDLGLREDTDFTVFVGIDSEADRFALGGERQYWNKEALAQLDTELVEFERSYLPAAQAACRAVIARLGFSK